jgi:hypothetical protein
VKEVVSDAVTFCHEHVLARLVSAAPMNAVVIVCLTQGGSTAVA